MWIFTSLYSRNPSELHESSTIFAIWSIEKEENRTKTSLHLPWSRKLSLSLPSFLVPFLFSFLSFSMTRSTRIEMFSLFHFHPTTLWSSLALYALFCRLNVVITSTCLSSMFQETSLLDRTILDLDIAAERSYALGFAEAIDWRN